jgi:hypothetical protein
MPINGEMQNPMQGIPQPPMAGGTSDVGPEARAQLLSMLEDMKTKQGQLNSARFAEKNNDEDYRQKALMEVFQSMQAAGVDPSNVDEVRSFLDELEKTNPELYQTFVEAFNILVGGTDNIGLPPGNSALPQTGGALSSLVGGAQGQEGMPPSGMPGIEPPTGGIVNRFPNLSGK